MHELFLIAVFVRPVTARDLHELIGNPHIEEEGVA